MKDFTILSSDLDTAFDKLFTFCKDNNCKFCVNPMSNTIEVLQIQSKTSFFLVAMIHIVDVTEPYELVREMLKEI